MLGRQMHFFFYKPRSSRRDYKYEAKPSAVTHTHMLHNALIWPVRFQRMTETLFLASPLTELAMLIISVFWGLSPLRLFLSHLGFSHLSFFLSFFLSVFSFL